MDRRRITISIPLPTRLELLMFLIGMLAGVIILTAVALGLELAAPLALLPAIRTDWRSFEVRRECREIVTPAILVDLGFDDGPARWPEYMTAEVLPLAERRRAA
jgi:hypothetical protein